MTLDHLTAASLRRLLEKDNDEEQNRLLLLGYEERILDLCRRGGDAVRRGE